MDNVSKHRKGEGRHNELVVPPESHVTTPYRVWMGNNISILPGNDFVGRSHGKKYSAFCHLLLTLCLIMSLEVVCC